MQIKFLFLIFVMVFSGCDFMYAGSKKLALEIYFDGDLDSEKMPRGEGVLHVYKSHYNEFKNKSECDKKTELMTISGNFMNNDITNAEIKSGDCYIKGDISYKIESGIIFSFKSVTLENSSYKLEKPVTFKQPLNFHTGEYLGIEKTDSIKDFYNKKYNETKQNGTDFPDDFDTSYDELAECFDTSVESYLWLISICQHNGKLQIKMDYGDTAKLANNGYLAKGWYYFSSDGDSIWFEPENYSKMISLRKAHIKSNSNVIYDGHWNGGVGNNNFGVRITYPDGSSFDGYASTDFLKLYNNYVGLNVYKILKNSDRDFLKLYNGTLTKPNGEQQHIYEGHLDL